MRLPTTLESHTGIALAVSGVPAGFVIGGADGAVLAALVGFFLGQSIRSVLRTAAIGS